MFEKVNDLCLHWPITLRDELKKYSIGVEVKGLTGEFLFNLPLYFNGCHVTYRGHKEFKSHLNHIQ